MNTKPYPSPKQIKWIWYKDNFGVVDKPVHRKIESNRDRIVFRYTDRSNNRSHINAVILSHDWIDKSESNRNMIVFRNRRGNYELCAKAYIRR